MDEITYPDHFQSLRERYDSALGKSNFDKLVVYSGARKIRFQDDMPYPFFINVQFKAIVPILDAIDSWVVWEVDRPPLLLLYQPTDFWHKVPELKNDFWVSFFDIKIITEKAHSLRYFGDIKRSAFVGETNEFTALWSQGQQNPQALIAELDWHRSFKTCYEISCIEEANRISAQGHVAAREAYYGGASEFVIALAFQQASQQCEEALAYPSIVGVNQHASILHYWGRDVLAPANAYSLLIDAGASHQGYAADITRTYAAETGLFADMIVALESVQLALVDRHRVGAEYFDLSMEMLKKIAELLKDCGVLKIDPQLAVETDIISHFIPHPLGHFLGLQVHDVGRNLKGPAGELFNDDPKYPLFRMLRPIERNQAVTVEPGIYFIDYLLKGIYQSKNRNSIDWDLIEQLKPYGGIRIEDNIVITGDKPINLTRNFLDDATPPSEKKILTSLSIETTNL